MPKTLSLYNTLTQKKEAFQPLVQGKVSAYCCGVTPYDSTHIGHTRTFFSYDLLYRVLRDLGYEVHWARNVTDIDDKIIQKANAEACSCTEIARRYIAEQDEMLQNFQLLKPEFEPTVTGSISEIVSLIQNLVDKSYAYASTTGVYFRVRKFQGYGKLSKNKIEELSQGARIAVDESKENPLDFALWKFAKEGEVSWDSPWGAGRPGWHIECSAMVHSLFGDSIDIHMGGRDLIFPHHEAEIAQSEAATGKPFSTVWMHTGMVTLYGEKMSKSTNHFVAIRDFLDKYPPEALRLFFLSTSYAQPLDFTFEVVQENLKKLARLYRFVMLVDGYEARSNDAQDSDKFFSKDIFATLPQLQERMQDALRDDLNSAAALSSFFEFVRSVNEGLGNLEKKGCVLSPTDGEILKTHWAKLKDWMGQVFGLFQRDGEEFFQSLMKYSNADEISVAEIQGKIDERSKARQRKDWALSDKIRQDLLNHGIQVQDTPTGSKWTVIL